MSNAFRGGKMWRRAWKNGARIVCEFNLAHGFAMGYEFCAICLARRLGGGGAPGVSAAPHLIKMHLLRTAYAIEMSKRYSKTIIHQPCIRLALSPIN